jgi:hypothetical protein
MCPRQDSNLRHTVRKGRDGACYAIWLRLSCAKGSQRSRHTTLDDPGSRHKPCHGTAPRHAYAPLVIHDWSIADTSRSTDAAGLQSPRGTKAAATARAQMRRQLHADWAAMVLWKRAMDPDWSPPIPSNSPRVVVSAVAWEILDRARPAPRANSTSGSRAAGCAQRRPGRPGRPPTTPHLLCSWPREQPTAVGQSQGEQQRYEDFLDRDAGRSSTRRSSRGAGSGDRREGPGCPGSRTGARRRPGSRPWGDAVSGLGAALAGRRGGSGGGTALPDATSAEPRTRPSQPPCRVRRGRLVVARPSDP